jgi:non-reducing end alpha-L-arabinofuranosidase
MRPALLLSAVAAAREGPCDITAAAGNLCFAAHSTTRALYAAYDGPLYRVTRASDGASANISTLAAGGFANAATHDAFCDPQLDCVIATVFDQSPMGNHLGQRHKLVNASRHKITVGNGGTPVYGMWFDPGYGYHVDKTKGVALGNEPESIYAVMSGDHYNGHCCFE